MKLWMMLIPVVLLSGCMVTEGDERLPSPTATWTQMMGEVTAADVTRDAEGHYLIPDQGDGCEYHETTPDIDPTPIVIDGVELPERVPLWSDTCPIGWDYEPSTGRLNPVIP